MFDLDLRSQKYTRLSPVTLPSQKNEHFVQFFESDSFLAEAVAQYIAAGLKEGHGAIVIATRPHLDAIVSNLEQLYKIDIEMVRSRSQLKLLDAAETLATFMSDGQPDAEKFENSLGQLVGELSAKFSRVCAFGEMVGLLWDEGNVTATIRLENLWNDLAKHHSFGLFCGYSLKSFSEHSHGVAFQDICHTHTKVLPSEDFLKLESVDDQLRAVAYLQQQASTLRLEMKRAQDAEIKLKESQLNLNDFFDNAALGLHWVAADGTILRVNRAELDLLGYSEDEYIGRHISEFHADEDVINDILTRLCDKQTLKSYPARLKCKNGDVKHVLIDSNVLWRDGKFIHTRCFTRDVTEQHLANQSLNLAHEQLRESEAFKNAILDNSRDCIKVLDLETRLLFINQGGANELELCDINQILGTHWLDFWNEEDRKLANRAFELAKTGQVGNFTGYFPTLKTKTPKWWNVVVSPIMEGSQTTKILAVSRDVTESRLAEREIEEREAQFRTLANSIPNLAWMAAANGSITWYNDRWYSYTGTTPEEMEGWGWQNVHDPLVLPSVCEQGNHSIATGDPFEMEFPLRSKTGDFRVFLTRVNPIRNSNGKIVRWFGTNTDIEEVRKTREALKESVHTLETLNSLGQTISAELDLEKLVQKITDAATQLSRAKFGALFYNVTNDKGEAYTLYSLSGAPREAFSRFGMPRNTPVFAPTFSGESVVRSDDITQDPRYGKNSPNAGMPQGHLPVKSYLAVPVISRSKEVIGGLFFGHPEPGIFTDKEENIVRGLAAQAATAIDNARLFQKSLEAIQSRDTFLSIASHELKTPLTSLKLQTQMRKRAVERGDFRRFDPEKLPNLLADDEKQINRLTRLVDDMLDIARIQTGKLSLEFEKFDLRSLVQESIERFSALLQSSGSTVELEGSPAYGYWDRYRIEQIVTNLLTNAIKYGAGSKIEIQIRVKENFALLSVRDYGIGIAKEDHGRIFGQFERAVSHSGISGFGLGLYIVKQLAEAHQGEISLESELGQGSTFTLKLPCEAPV